MKRGGLRPVRQPFGWQNLVCWFVHPIEMKVGYSSSTFRLCHPPSGRLEMLSNCVSWLLFNALESGIGGQTAQGQGASRLAIPLARLSPVVSTRLRWLRTTVPPPDPFPFLSRSRRWLRPPGIPCRLICHGGVCLVPAVVQAVSQSVRCWPCIPSVADFV